MTRSMLVLLAGTALSGAVAAVPQSAVAQTAEQSAPSESAAPTSSVSTDQADPSSPITANTNQPGDIVVTAQKRSERLQDVPVAVTAIGGDALASRQINDTSALTQAVPSLTFNQGANPTNTSLRIRGVGTQLFGQGTPWKAAAAEQCRLQIPLDDVAIQFPDL